MQEKENQLIKRFADSFAGFVSKSINLAQMSLSPGPNPLMKFNSRGYKHLAMKNLIISSFLGIIKRTVSSYSQLLVTLEASNLGVKLEGVQEELSRTIKELNLDLRLPEVLTNHISYPDVQDSQEIVISSIPQELINDYKSHGIWVNNQGEFYKGDLKKCNPYSYSNNPYQTYPHPKEGQRVK